MNILYIGCVESSYVLLKALIENKVSICGVITKSSSKFNSDFVDLSPLCEKHKIDYYYTENSKEQGTVDFIKKKKPDVIYCFGWSHLLSKEIINLSKLGVVGFHPANLPYNKGRHPLIWALVLGLEQTATTFFMIDEKADNGDIISKEFIKIDFTDNARTLYNKVMEVAKKQVIEITKGFEEETIVYVKQNSEEGNVWRKRTINDGKIDFRMSSMAIYNLVRGLTRPYVGAHLEYEGNEYKVWSTEIIQDKNNSYFNIEPGKIIEVYSESSFLVKTGDGLIKVTDADETNLMVGDYL